MPKEQIRNLSYIGWHRSCRKNTDDEHYITMPEIKAALEEYDVTADRKSIYADLRDLQALGVEVEGGVCRKPLSLSCSEPPV